MAAAGSVIYSLLSSNGALSAQVGTRIYPDIAPQNTAFPFCVYTEISTDPTDTKDGASKLDVKRLQIDVYSRSYDTTNTIAELVRAVLDRYSGTNSGVNVDKIWYDDEQTGSYDADMYVFWRSLDFQMRIIR